MDDATRAAAEAALQHTFKDPSLLRCALTHASLAEIRTQSNERMEFLGDAVLGLIVCESLYTRFPNLLEGEMTKIKSLVVSRQTCAEIARALGLPGMLALGKGMQSGDDIPQSLAAASLESVVAAIYLDGGYEAAAAFLRRQFDPAINEAAASRHQQNYKSFLQQHAQQNRLPTPVYRVLDEQGPDHSKCFKVGIEMGDRRFTPCWGQTKKKAEQDAALSALRELNAFETGPSDSNGTPQT